LPPTGAMLAPVGHYRAKLACASGILRAVGAAVKPDNEDDFAEWDISSHFGVDILMARRILTGLCDGCCVNASIAVL